MTKPLVLLSDIILARTEQALIADYRVERLWDWEDRAAFLAGPGQEVEAIVHAGEVVLAADFIDALPRLKIIACVSVGYDGVYVPRARARGVEVTHAAWLNADDVADFAIGLMIAGFRGIVSGHDYVLSGDWSRRVPRRAVGALTGKTLGIVGLGHIGEAIAARAAAMKMNIAWWGPRAKDSAWRRAESVLALADQSDVLMIACRADETNRGLVDGPVLRALGKRGLLVNISRGQVVQEDDLIGALQSGELGMAALDVFWKEPTPADRWQDVPNVTLAPHAAGSTAETLVQMVAQMLENLRRCFAGQPLLSPVPPE